MRLIIIFLIAISYANAAELTVFSQNAWFDDETGEKGRYDQLLKDIPKDSVDVICLQEVTKALFDKVKTFAKEYQFNISGAIDKNYGNVTMSKYNVIHSEYKNLPTHMNRKALVTSIFKNGSVIKIVNVHLDSMLEDTHRRISQIETIKKSIMNGGAVIIAGDFNFGDNDKENQYISYFNDAGRNSPSPTYDTENNEFAKTTKFSGEPLRRLDRIMASKLIPINNYEIIKTKNSDHYGIKATITIMKSQKVD